MTMTKLARARVNTTWRATAPRVLRGASVRAAQSWSALAVLGLVRDDEARTGQLLGEQIGDCRAKCRRQPVLVVLGAWQTWVTTRALIVVGATGPLRNFPAPQSWASAMGTHRWRLGIRQQGPPDRRAQSLKVQFNGVCL
ncbi:uncharacterized protein B0I36DRAFT_351333 [Microdochium trichocladiopsis]|uniref:Uncharacterized protein n=1 Tax=Microdochium trichocladiopsis TaxID=1682393 RepID=A0A9P8Y2W1_9PEZI|nr:uncharacterized protein B0I36DRAFT_351333 [Microdochium trichocladiopsis]KAH7027859.1 hypothetical protein B0I36DRAFT_351333 [Microdochium trichocladiopsis]